MTDETIKLKLDCEPPETICAQCGSDTLGQTMEIKHTEIKLMFPHVFFCRTCITEAQRGLDDAIYKARTEQVKENQPDQTS